MIPVRIGLDKVFCREHLFWQPSGHSSFAAVLQGNFTIHYQFQTRKTDRSDAYFSCVPKEEVCDQLRYTDTFGTKGAPPAFHLPPTSTFLLE